MSGPRRVPQARVLIALGASLAILATLPAVGMASAARSAGTQVAPRAEGSLVTIRQPGARTTLALPGQLARDISVVVHVRTNRRPVGPGQAMAIIIRRNVSGEYRARMQFAANGKVLLSVSQFNAGRRRQIGRPVAVALGWLPGDDIVLRAEARGARPTRVRVTAWLAADPEPGLPQLSASGVAPTVAGQGVAALRFALPGDAGNAPVQFEFGDVSVSPGGVIQPDPSPTPSGAPPPTATAPAPTPTAAPLMPSPSPAPPTRSPSPAPPTATPPPAPMPSPSAAPSTPPDGAYYVSPQGDDGAAGTRDHPWRTPQKAADSAPAGATVLLRGGIYPPFVMRRSGTATAPITFTSYPGESAVVDGRDTVAYTVWLSGVRWVNLSGLVVQGGYAERHNGGGIMVENAAHVVVSGNVARDNKAFGIRSQGSTYVTIADNEVTRNAVGVHVGGAGEGTVVARNRIHDNNKMMVNTPDIRGDDVGAGGVALVRTVGHVLVRDNLVWANRAPSYDYGYDGSAFEIYAAQNWEFTGNTAWDNRVGFETGTDSNRTPCSGGRFTRNVIYGAATVDVSRGMVLRCAENAVVANNTFAGVQDFVFTLQHAVGTYGGSIDGLRIANNVISVVNARVYSVDSAIPASVRIDYDLINITGSGYLAQMVGNGSTRSLATFNSWRGDAAHAILGDPLFANPADHDYTPRGGSPAIDSGVVIDGVTNGHNGAAPDRGALETGR